MKDLKVKSFNLFSESHRTYKETRKFPLSIFQVQTFRPAGSNLQWEGRKTMKHTAPKKWWGYGMKGLTDPSLGFSPKETSNLYKLYTRDSTNILNIWKLSPEPLTYQFTSVSSFFVLHILLKLISVQVFLLPLPIWSLLNWSPIKLCVQ